MKIIKRIIFPTILLSVFFYTSPPLFAKQHLNDADLADLQVGNSFVVHNIAVKKNKQPLIDTHRNQPAAVYLTMNEETNHSSEELDKQKSMVNETGTRHFGSERYSYFWAGNHDDILDINDNPGIIINPVPGLSRLSNVDAVIYIDVETR